MRGGQKNNIVGFAHFFNLVEKSVSNGYVLWGQPDPSGSLSRIFGNVLNIPGTGIVLSTLFRA